MRLLTAVLEPSSPIGEVEVLNPEITPEQIDDKGIALDVHVSFRDGRHLDVEMQADKRPAFRNRSLFYWSRVYGSQLERGQLYTALHPVISVLFLDYVELDGQRLHSTFRILEAHDYFPYTDHLEMHVIELPKRPPLRAAGRQIDSDLISWTRFLGATSDEEVREACMSDRNVSKANELLEHLSAKPSAVELARQRKLALDTYRIEMGAAKEEGKAEGREEGRAEGRAETLIELLQTKFGAIDAASMSRVRSGAEDDVRRWTRRVLTASTLAELLEDG